MANCAPEELRIREVNASVYCFDAGALRWVLPRLSDADAQDEYRLSDAGQVLAEGGRRVETGRTDDPEKTLGVNDPADLGLARAEGWSWPCRGDAWPQ